MTKKGIVILISVLFAASSNAFAGGNASNGAAIAQTWCAQCHDIQPNGPIGNSPPGFSEISRQGVGRFDARNIYPDLHANMPQIRFVLTPQNADDLIEYIGSLD